MSEPSPFDRAAEARRSLYRQQILDAAEQCFARRGYEGTRMEDIAKEASVGMATLYRHYEGKQQLYGALERERATELFAAGSSGVSPDHEPIEALVAFVSGYYRYLLEHPRTVEMQLRTKSSWGVDEREPWHEPRAYHAALIQDAIDAGLVVDLDAMFMAKMMAAMHQVQVADWIERGMIEDHETQIDTMLDILRRAFVRSPA